MLSQYRQGIVPALCQHCTSVVTASLAACTTLQTHVPQCWFNVGQRRRREASIEAASHAPPVYRLASR